MYGRPDQKVVVKVLGICSEFVACVLMTRSNNEALAAQCCCAARGFGDVARCAYTPWTLFEFLIAASCVVYKTDVLFR